MERIVRYIASRLTMAGERLLIGLRKVDIIGALPGREEAMVQGWVAERWVQVESGSDLVEFTVSTEGSAHENIAKGYRGLAKSPS